MTIISISASSCPAGSTECKGQKPQDGGEGCSAGDLAYWFKDSIIHPKPPARAAEAEAADDAGAIARRLPPGAGGAGCEAIAERKPISFGPKMR